LELLRCIFQPFAPTQAIVEFEVSFVIHILDH
jgi:hypothetical protein